MLAAAEDLRFEYAAKLRDEIKDLRRELDEAGGRPETTGRVRLESARLAADRTEPGGSAVALDRQDIERATSRSAAAAMSPRPWTRHLRRSPRTLEELAPRPSRPSTSLAGVARPPTRCARSSRRPSRRASDIEHAGRREAERAPARRPTPRDASTRADQARSHVASVEEATPGDALAARRRDGERAGRARRRAADGRRTASRAARRQSCARRATCGRQPRGAAPPRVEAETARRPREPSPSRSEPEPDGSPRRRDRLRLRRVEPRTRPRSPTGDAEDGAGRSPGRAQHGAQRHAARARPIATSPRTSSSRTATGLLDEVYARAAGRERAASTRPPLALPNGAVRADSVVANTVRSLDRTAVTSHDRTSRRPRAQPQGRHRRAAARRPGRHHRAVRLGQVVAGLRHDLRRGPAPLRRVAVRVRAPVPRADGQARRRLDRGPVAGDLDRPEDDLAQPALDGRHGHRDLRLPAPAVGAGRPAALPHLRAADRRRSRPSRSSTR